jgi:cyclophilin family peptidyl-prolyl cis-trans isomerase
MNRPAIILASFAVLACALRAAAPVLDDPLPATGEPARVTPEIPVGKTLLFPITASNADGDPLLYKVTSSNPNIFVRAKTGNPVLRMSISHADGGEADPPYAGTMDFMLFRDWLPITTGYVSGMARAGFYSNVLFHRVADLGGGLGTTGFIFQGGDPIGSGGGGPGMVANDPQTAWKFQNEFHEGTIFSGRGQLAMANAGTSTGYSLGANGTLLVPDYLDTNGSQFFITDGQPRHLDFKHNIFGQLLRGWEVLPLLKATKTTSSRPDRDLRILSAGIVDNETDAVLVLSAKAVGTAKISVTVCDPSGAATVKEFMVSAVPDTSNCNPFLRRVPPRVTRKNVPAVFALEMVDLEFDYMDAQHSMLPLSATLGPKGSLLASSGRVVQMQPNAGYEGLVNIGFSLRQYDIGRGSFDAISDYTNAYVAVGERLARAGEAVIEAQPGVALVNVIAGRVHDLDVAGAPANFTAKINWGDGTPLTTATIARDTGAPGTATYVALGGHTYALPGVYPLVVDFTGNNGARTLAHGTAVVTAAPLRAVGENFDLSSGRVINRVIATFTDAAPVAPRSYSAVIDWGDGGVSAGVVSRDAVNGRYIVRGTHGYRDSEPFSVRVRIHKKDNAPANDAIAWTTITPFFKTTPHLPPFPHGKLTVAWNSGPNKTHSGTPGPDYQVKYSGTFVIINTGNRNLGASALRFWLSNDRVLDTAGPAKDTPLKVNNQRILNIIPFPAGAGGSGGFTITIPKGESTGRKYLIGEAVYRQPTADADGSGKYVVTGPLPPTALLSATTGLTTTEGGGTATFTVVLDTPPDTTSRGIASIAAGSPVTVNTSEPHGFSSGNEIRISGVTGGVPEINGVHTVTVVDGDTFTVPVDVTEAGMGGKAQINPKVTIPLESTLPTEGTVLPANLVFDPANWNVPQTITITGVDDANADGSKNYKILLKAAQSPDALFNGLVAGEVSVTNTDNEPAP